MSAAIEQSAHAGDIDLRVHTFQLDPATPRTIASTLEYLSGKYGVPAAQAAGLGIVVVVVAVNLLGEHLAQNSEGR